MNTTEKKFFNRQMYTRESEVGRMKLQSVKENLYETTTKIVLYSIEMYTKKDIMDWVRNDLILKLDKLNNDLRREKGAWQQGNIGMFDITNGCSVINDFIRKDALKLSRDVLQEKIELQESKIAEIEKKEKILEQRKEILESLEDKEDQDEISDEVKDFFDEGDNNYWEDAINNFDEGDQANYEEDNEDEDDEEDYEKEQSLQELEIFESRVLLIKEFEELADIVEELRIEKEEINKLLKNLKDLTRGGEDTLTHQFESEKESLDNLRTLRNTVFAHRSEDEQEISLIGTWEPEAGPLYLWASEILKYIKIIEERYETYKYFDDYYTSHEGKDKFDGCKVYVQRQIKELYVNQSGIALEFAGDLYDKEDDEYNFKKLIENMAIRWDTGIRYLTVVTNDDLPELNVFFRECLSGTNKYVDSYLLDRNALRDAYKRREPQNIDYVYFKLLYHLNPAMEKIYWRDKVYEKDGFAKQVIYKFIKVKNMFQFDARLKEYEKYIDGIDIAEWSQQHLLSEVYFDGLDDLEGKNMAKEMEDAIIEFCCHSENKGRTLLYRRAIKASVQLYFYMGKDYVFSYTRSNGQTIRWRTLEAARKYMENGKNFGSYLELCGFVDELYKSDYFKIWRNQLKRKAENEREV